MTPQDLTTIAELRTVLDRFCTEIDSIRGPIGEARNIARTAHSEAMKAQENCTTPDAADSDHQLRMLRSLVTDDFIGVHCPEVLAGRWAECIVRLVDNESAASLERDSLREQLATAYEKATAWDIVHHGHGEEYPAVRFGWKGGKVRATILSSFGICTTGKFMVTEADAVIDALRAMKEGNNG